MIRSRALRPRSSRLLIATTSQRYTHPPTRAYRLRQVLWAALALVCAAGPTHAGHATTGRWIGPISMGRVKTGAEFKVRATHAAVLSRRTAAGDSTLIVHWHDKDTLRVWRYDYNPQGGFSADTTFARLLSPPAQNEFCSGHASLHDGRLLVAGGTAPGVGSEIGTTEVSAFDPSQTDLWTSTSHWVVQDSMRFNRWYPLLTHLGDGTVVANAGVEYFEMPAIGGESPQDSTGPFRALRSLGLSRFPTWPVEPMNLDTPLIEHPKLKDHVSIPSGQQQQRKDGRGLIVTFGGVDGTGSVTDQTWWTWDVAVDAHNSWRTELLPLTGGSPKPAARSQHAAGIVETATGLGAYELRLFVYGGRDASGNALNDVWYLNKPDNNTAATWQQITPTGPSPGHRYGHTAVFDPGARPNSLGSGLPTQYYPKLIVFGGKRSPTVWAGTDTVFVLQLWQPYAWHALVLSGSKPAPRYRHAATVDRDLRPGQTRIRMFLFGGAGDQGPLLNDAWSLSRAQTDSAYASWVWFSDPASSVPPAVYKHSMVHDEQWNRLLVFGGDRSHEGATAETNTQGETNETFVRSVDVFVADTSWRKLETTAPILRRSGHSAVYYWSKAVNARVPERFEPLAAEGQRWSSLTGSPKFDRITYPFMFEVPDGRLFYAGRNDSSAMLPATLSGAWGDHKPAAHAASMLATATAIQYLPERVLKVGGKPDGTGSAANRAEFAGGSHQWYAASTLNLRARGNPNVTILPNGQVLLTGGRKADGNQDGSNSADAVREPQAWSPPPDNVWTSGATALQNEPTNRGYHSTAILLPDGRVLSAGGDPGPTLALSDPYYHGTIFEPPYLFDPNSSGGDGYITRPTIDVAPKFVGHGCTFTLTVTASNGVSSVCLIRPGAVTHAFNQDQRYVPLGFTQSGSTVTVDGPLDARTAPPGDYLLFVLDNTSRKVPSVARWVRVTESIGPYHAADVDRPARTLSLNGTSGQNGTNCTLPVNMTWTSPSDDSNFTTSGRVRLLDLRSSTTTICDNCWAAFAAAEQVVCEPPAGLPGQAQSLAIHGLSIGTYYFRMVSRDDKSATTNYSGMSNAKTVSVFGCEEGFTGGGGGGGGGSSARWAGTSSAGSTGTSEAGDNSFQLPAAGDGTDFLQMASPRLADGRLRFHLRRGVTGETQVKQAALVMAEHPADREVFRVAGEWRLGRRVPALSAVSRSGVDHSSLLAGDSDLWLVGDSGDTVTVNLAPDPSGATTSAIYLDAHAGRIAGVGEPGLRVLHRDAGGTWREAAMVLPRSRFATLAVPGIEGDEVRLAFHGNHAIRGIGRLALEGAATVTRSAASELTHSALGALDGGLLAAGGAGVVLGPRERVDLGFDPPAAGATEARSYFLEVTGTSTSGDALAARARPGASGTPLPTALELGLPVPNPFAAGTTLRLGLLVATQVRADVYDLAGRRVATVARGRLDAGWHTLAWDGRSRSGSQTAPGIYLLRVVADRRTFDRRLVVMP